MTSQRKDLKYSDVTIKITHAPDTSAPDDGRNGKFECFHFKHRPEVAKPKSSAVDQKPQKTGTCCCVFQTVDKDALADFIEKYNDANWIDSKGDYIKARCVIHKIRVSHVNSTEKIAISQFNYQLGTYSTRAEKGYTKRHAPTENFSHADLMSLSEMRPPIQVMPRGNIGTTLREFMNLINQCKLPPRIIKKLDLKFPTTGSLRRYGNVPFEYADAWEKIHSGGSTYTANGETIEVDVEIDYEETSKKEKTLLHEKNETKIDSGHISDPDADDDTCEEWERHEALHNDVTSQERDKERLFEEEIELKWEKGGSGLVFYTDAQYWQEQEGDFDEQTTDDWDVDMSIYYGEKGDMDAQQYLQMRRERRNGKAVYDNSLLTDLNPHNRKRKQKRSRSESPQSKRRGQFERHTKGVGRKLLEKGGWKEGDPLGPGQRSGAITDPIELEGQHPRLRKGLGYHGEKLLKSSTFSDTESTIKRSTRAKIVPTLFRGTRSVEPNAPHSWMFPQFAFNLANNDYKERTRKSRKQAVPGIDDGIVITTKYDEPLYIDERDDFLRSRHPAALKHRQKPAANVGNSSTEFDATKSRKSNVSKLVKPVINCDDTQTSRTENFPKEHGNDENAPIPSTLHLSAVKFVKGGVLKED
ncbi:G patch domain-containing protein 3-like [Styela clava]